MSLKLFKLTYFLRVEPNILAEGLDIGGTNFVGSIYEISVKDMKNILPASAKDTQPYSRLLIAAEFNERNVKQIFSDFIKFTFPSRAMNATSFTEYMKHIGWTKNNSMCENLYRSFKTYKSYYVRVNEVKKIAARTCFLK